MTFSANKPKMQTTNNGVAWVSVLKYNGKVIAHVENDGRGACDNWVWVDKARALEFADAAEAFNKNVEPHFFEKLDHRNLPDPDYCSQFFESLMQQAEQEAKFKLDCKKHVVVQLPNKAGYSIFKNTRPTPDVVAQIIKQFPDAKILNPGVVQ